MQNAGLDEAQTEIKIARRNVYNFRYADDTTFMSESEKGTKEPLDERGEWKSWLKTQIQNMKIMEYGPIISWQVDGETVETMIKFILEGSKITADGDWSPEIKRSLLLGRKAMTSLDSILKSKDITSWQRSV